MPKQKPDKYQNEKQIARDFGSGLNDVIGRGPLAGLLGIPGDTLGLLKTAGVWANNKVKDFEYATGLLKAKNGNRKDKAQMPGYLSYPEGNAYGGAEDIGNRMEGAGLVSSVRRPKTELLASLISPAGVAKTVLNAPKTARLALKALDNLEAPSTFGRGLGNSQVGAIDVSKYGMSHRPMTVDSGASTLDDLVPSFGEDIYTRQALQYFGSGDPRESQVLRQLARLRGTPDAEVTVYRGAPSDAESINAGDWVTLHPSVAKDYADSFSGGKVLSHKVPASHVTAWPDALLEQGYYPPAQPVGNIAKMVAPKKKKP